MKKIIFILIVTMASILDASAYDYLTPQEQLNGKYGYVSPTGQMIIRARYDRAMPFREGMAAVEINGRWGYINQQGRTVVKTQFDEAYDFNGGYGIVVKKGLYGAVDAKGEQVVPCEYEKIGDLLNLHILKLSPQQSAELERLLKSRGN